jgi:hypothetical protein
MSRISFSPPAAAILLALATGCGDQPPTTPPAATDVQASPTPPTAGKAVKEKEVRTPGPPTTLAPD